MAQNDILKIEAKKKSLDSSCNKIRYVSGKESGLQPRGNVLLAQERYLLSLQPNRLHKFLFRLFF